MPPHRPPLAAAHDDREAKTTAFGGWEMPVSFDSIRSEHDAVREDVGTFDVSHMGQIRVDGPDATELMQRLTSNDVTRLEAGDAQYAVITASDGTIVDDTVIYRLDGDGGHPTYLFVPNAGTDESITDRWRTHRDEWGLTASVENQTRDYAMVAVQGPNAVTLVDDLTPASIADLDRFEHTAATVTDVDCRIARTGYTGEDGLELLCPWEEATTLWDALECQPCGLGARDTLRIEAGFLLAGQEFDQDENRRTPFEAGIEFTVALETAFVGRDALTTQRASDPEQRLVGVTLEERGVPRHGYEIQSPDGESIGTVTSGTMSPTLGEPIALGYVPTAYSEPDTALAVTIRGQQKSARITATPFIE